MSETKETPRIQDDRVLPAVRKEIDKIDEDILELLNRRARVSRRVGRIKAGGSGQYFKPAREKVLIEKLASKNPGPLPNSHLEAIYREIMSSSRCLQMPERIVYLGPEGTFSYFAGLKFLGRSGEFTPRPNFEGIFAAIHSGEADLGVVPIENSLEGTVGQSLDLLQAYPLHAQAEVFLRISHSLMSSAENLSEVSEIYSHPQPLAQCSGWLAANMPGARLIPVESTAAAARRVGKKKHQAAIGHQLLAEMFDLRVLAGPIEDQPDNWTRFFIIAKARVVDSLNTKTSVLFTTPDKPGALAQVLQTLAEGGVNITKLESRPSKTEKWKYVFFADLECDLYREEHARTLKALQEACSTLRLLGSYPVGPYLDDARSAQHLEAE